MPTSRETWDEIRSEYRADAKTSENSMTCNAPQNESKPRLRVLAYIRLPPQIRITNWNDTE
jgi:hypothetical protein